MASISIEIKRIPATLKASSISVGLRSMFFPPSETTHDHCGRPPGSNSISSRVLSSSNEIHDQDTPTQLTYIRDSTYPNEREISSCHQKLRTHNTAVAQKRNRERKASRLKMTRIIQPILLGRRRIRGRRRSH